jgi:hypothetical protein
VDFELAVNGYVCSAAERTSWRAGEELRPSRNPARGVGLGHVQDWERQYIVARNPLCLVVSRDDDVVIRGYAILYPGRCYEAVGNEVEFVPKLAEIAADIEIVRADKLPVNR